MREKIKKLMETRANLVEEARKKYDVLKASAEKDGVEINAEDEAGVDRMFDEVDKLTAEIDRLEADEKRGQRLGNYEQMLDRPANQVSRDMPESRIIDPSNRRATPEYVSAFEAFLRNDQRMTPEQRATLQADSDVGGGFFYGSERFIGSLLKNADATIALRQYATTHRLNRGETLGQPTLASTITGFSRGGELTDAGEDTNMSFGKRELKPRDFQRKLVKVSNALLESPRLNVEQVVIDEVMIALRKTLAEEYMTGNGAEECLGLFTASDDGIGTARDVSTGNTATEIKFDGLINAQGTLHSAYDPNARWLFHKDAVTQLRKEKDGESRYMWQVGTAVGQPNTILNKPYILDDYVPNTFTTGLYVGMYGDFSWYWIADAVEMAVKRLVETYATTGQTGFLFEKMAADAAPWKAEAFVRIKLG